MEQAGPAGARRGWPEHFFARAHARAQAWPSLAPALAPALHVYVINLRHLPVLAKSIVRPVARRPAPRRP